jgi:hypothetical protein
MIREGYSRRDFFRRNSIAGLGTVHVGSLSGSFLTSDANAKSIETSARLDKILDLDQKIIVKNIW